MLRNEARCWGDKSTAGVNDFNSFSKVFNYSRLDVEACSHEFDVFMDRKEDDFCAARTGPLQADSDWGPMKQHLVVAVGDHQVVIAVTYCAIGNYNETPKIGYRTAR